VTVPRRRPAVEYNRRPGGDGFPGRSRKVLRPEDTARIASDLIGTNELVLRALHEQGACDLSYSLPERSRFRVNVFRQRGTYAIVMRGLKSTMRTRDYLEQGDKEGRSLLDAMRDGELDGMQHFDGELEKLVRAGVISFATAYLYATNPGNLRVQLADVAEDDDSMIVR
jgi:Tfp pilus assembly pilus retraction ATPase PilT